MIDFWDLGCLLAGGLSMPSQQYHIINKDKFYQELVAASRTPLLPLWCVHLGGFPPLRGRGSAKLQGQIKVQVGSLSCA